ncbi:MAG: acetylxylan esterase, partial [bacterium]
METRPMMLPFSSGLLILAVACAGPAARDDSPPDLRQGSHQSEEAGRKQLEDYASTFDSAQQWQKRAAIIRQQILRGAELDPMPARPPIEAIIHDRRIYDGYSVESIAIETVPGFYLTGSIYRPTEGDGPFPGVLSPHG